MNIYKLVFPGALKMRKPMSGRAMESPGTPTQGQASFAGSESRTPTVGGLEICRHIATWDG